MRTKTLLITAALSAAGALTSMAQTNVYSVNVVGYINLTAPPGFSLLANQLDVDGTNKIGAVLNNANANPVGIDGIQLLRFKNNNYTIDAYDGTGNAVGFVGWYDNGTGNPSTNTIGPGSGFFLYNPYNTNIILTLTGNVKQGTNSIPIPAGFSLNSTVAPQAVVLDTTPTNNFPATDGMEYLAYTNIIGNPGNYAVPDFYDATGNAVGFIGWYDNGTGLQVFPTPAVGQGYFIFNPGASNNWSRNFTVQ